MPLSRRDLVAIRPNGAILLGKNIVADGFERRKIHVISHAHADHLGGIGESLKYAEKIIATPATIELILELGYILSSARRKRVFREKAHPLDYHQPFIIGGEELTLYKAEHIIGAAQVVVETENMLIGYTGDFKLTENTEVIIEPDILVIETTYGDPRYRRPFKHDVEQLLVDLVYQGITTYGRVIIYGYHGKLQEAMRILRRNDIDTPFLMPRKIYRITRIAEKYGDEISNYHDVDSLQGKQIYRDGLYVYFEHMMKAKYRRLTGRSLNIILSGWEFRQPVRKLDPYTWLVALSDHADFDELIEYVERSRPRITVLDSSRQGSPKPLYRELSRRGYKTIIMP